MGVCNGVYEITLLCSRVLGDSPGFLKGNQGIVCS